MKTAQPQAIYWFYEDKGQRNGPVSEEAITQLIRASTISPGTQVWTQGFPEWMRAIYQQYLLQ